ncbi:hypothetical protein J5X84_07940 [Streptosporangiaceae bacterium NEAU-GS5]|nr:hypothetical protein [Streptosporangiaceae bacterium NEAU-GS5]
MTTHDNSFTADGPNVVAFDNGPNFTVGVRVVGQELGVHGRCIGPAPEEGADPFTQPIRAGVWGEGFNNPGVLGTGPIGVEGIGDSGGIGVHAEGYTGLEARGTDGPGGRFRADPDRHSHRPRAQVEIVPTRVPGGGVYSYTASPQEWGGLRVRRNIVSDLPFEGQVGELLLITLEDADLPEPLTGPGATSLWLCVQPHRLQPDGSYAAAKWRQVLLGSVMQGDPI